MSKIVDVRTVVTCPGRNYVTVIIETADGITGIGDATLNGRELSVAAYLDDHLAPLLIGREADRIEDTWQYLYKGAYWRRGPVTMTAVSAVDVALWDIKAKAAGVPLYQLLGGACRDGVTIYGHASGNTVPDLLEDVQRFLDRGYRAVRAQCLVPGLDRVYGMRKGDGDTYEPADGNLPTVENWSTPAYLDFVPQYMRAVRDELGYGFHLLHDGHHRMTPLEAARLGKSLEPYRMFWLEDCTPAEDQDAFALVRRHTVTPLAVGEIFNTVHDCQHLITRRLIDYIRTSVSHAGGITHLKKIFSLAEIYGVKSGSHGAGDLSPASYAAALHLDMAIPNFGMQEYMGHVGPWEEVFGVSYRYEDGLMHPGEAPGIGVTFDEQAAGRFPYQRKYLPVNTLLDGTVHDW